MSSAIPFRPRSNSELFDAAFQLVRVHFGSLALLAAVIALPGLVLGVAQRALMPDLASGAIRPEDISLARFVWILPIALLSICWLFVGLGALVGAASDAYMGRPIQPAAVLRRAVSRAGALIGGNLLAYLLAILSFAGVGIVMAIVVPLLARSGSGGFAVLLAFVTFVAGIAFALSIAARYFVVTPVAMLEEQGATASLTRSAALTDGSRKRIVGLMILLFVVLFVIAATVFGALAAVVRNAYVVGALAGLLWIPLYPLITSLVTVVYYDLRIRKEGYDIELMAGDLGAAANQPAY